MVHLIGWILNKTRSPRRTLAACPVVTHAVHPRGEDCRRANARSVSVLGCLLGVGRASPASRAARSSAASSVAPTGHPPLFCGGGGGDESRPDDGLMYDCEKGSPLSSTHSAAVPPQDAETYWHVQRFSRPGTGQRSARARTGRRRSSSMWNHQDAFDGLLEAYRSCLEECIFEEIDYTNIQGITKAVIESFSDPSSVAKVKVRMAAATNHKTELEGIWERFAVENQKVLTEYETECLLRNYLEVMKRFIPKVRVRGARAASYSLLDVSGAWTVEWYI